MGRDETLAALKLCNQTSIAQEQIHQMQESASDCGLFLPF